MKWRSNPVMKREWRILMKEWGGGKSKKNKKKVSNENREQRVKNTKKNWDENII